jgi:hypothetical protein
MDKYFPDEEEADGVDGAQVDATGAFQVTSNSQGNATHPHVFLVHIGCQRSAGWLQLWKLVKRPSARCFLWFHTLPSDV